MKRTKKIFIIITGMFMIFLQSCSSNIDTLTKLSKPEIKKIHPNASCVYISWDKVDGAEWYVIFRELGKSKIEVKTTKKLECFIQSKNKEEYYYSVRAYCKDKDDKVISSDYSKSKLCRCNVKFGQAMSGEEGLTGNKAGNQNGTELKISEWHYDKNKDGHFHWTFIVRCKDPIKQKIVAKTVRDACNNKHVGYDMDKGDRITLWKEAKKKNWDVSKITKDCETSCTRVACVGLAAAGLTDFPKDIDSYDLKEVALNYKNDLWVITGKEYLTSPEKLRRGDILCCGPHHTVIITN